MELVKELMLPFDQCVTVSQEATVGECIRISHGSGDWRHSQGDSGSYRALLVLDGENRVVGKLNDKDIVSKMEPRYRAQREPETIAHIFAAGLSPALLKSMMERHSYWDETFTRSYQQVLNVKVKDCMHTPRAHECVQQGDPLELAVHQLVIGHHQSLLVTAAYSIVGTLTLTDVFHAMGRSWPYRNGQDHWGNGRVTL